MSAVTSSRARRGPLDPRLLRRGRATLTYLIAAVVVGSATAILAIVQARALADALGQVFETRSVAILAGVVPTLIAVFAGRAVLAWLNQVLAQRASAQVKSRLRRDVLAARLAEPAEPAGGSGGLVTLLTQGLDALDGYYARYLPQLVLAVTVPLIIGVAILTADLTAAVIVALTLPLIPLFMALVGWTTEQRVRRRWRVQTRLAGHFADLVAGLPTLQVFGRAKAQAEGLRRTEAAHRTETMGTLRISFLSALILEVLASLSVAIVAVVVGFRVVFHELDLTTAFFVLILAPEVYLPVRQVGVHYHDSADGMAAAESAFELIERAEADHRESAPPAEPAPAGALSMRGVGHRYPHATVDALAPVDLDVAPGELAVIVGPSGSGKTTLLNALMGFLRPTSGGFLLGGQPLDPATRRDRIAWVAQDPGLVAGTIADNVRLGDPGATDDEVRSALRSAGGAALDPARPVGDEGEGLSAGERRRVAVARALVRTRRGGIEVLVLDEPTAGLDAETELALLQALEALAVTIVAVSHRPAVIARADRVVRLSPPAPSTPVG